MLATCANMPTSYRNVKTLFYLTGLMANVKS